MKYEFPNTVRNVILFVKVTKKRWSNNKCNTKNLVGRENTMKKYQTWKMHLKGVVRPDRIYMRLVPLDRSGKGNQPLQVLNFFISVLNIWKDFKVLSSFIKKWIQSPACSDHGLYRILSSNWMAHFIWWKNLPKNWLYWFGLRDVEILHSRAVIQRTIVDGSRIFGARFGGKDHGMCPYCIRDLEK